MILIFVVFVVRAFSGSGSRGRARDEVRELSRSRDPMGTSWKLVGEWR